LERLNQRLYGGVGVRSIRNRGLLIRSQLLLNVGDLSLIGRDRVLIVTVG
jgi:hypothetical protein